MNHYTAHDDEGVLEALIEKITKHILPEALNLRNKVSQGEKLSNFEVEFMLQVYEDNKRASELFHSHQEYTLLATELMSLYSEIMEKGVSNEHK